MVQNNENKKFKILLWCAIAYMFIVALGMFQGSFIPGLIGLICGVALIPKVSEKINEKTNNKFSKNVKIAFFIICFFAIGITSPTSEESYADTKKLSNTSTKSTVAYENTITKNNYIKEQENVVTESGASVEKFYEESNQEVSNGKDDNENQVAESSFNSNGVNDSLNEQETIVDEQTNQNLYTSNESENNVDSQVNSNVEENVDEENNYSSEATAEVQDEAVTRYTATTTPATYSPNLSTSTYVLNNNTKKFHKASCSSVKTIADHNREDSSEDRQEIIDRGYAPCKRCNP